MKTRLEIHWDNGQMTAFPNVTNFLETEGEIKLQFGKDEADQNQAKIFKNKILFYEWCKN